MSSPSPPIAARVDAASSDAVNHLQPGAPRASTPSPFAPPPLEDKVPAPGPPVTPRRAQTDRAAGCAPTVVCDIDAASASSPSRTHTHEDPPATNEAEATTDVIVIEDAEHQTPASAASPGRTSARLRAKETAKRLRSASRKPERVGPATDSSLAEARQKKRKPGTASKPSAPPQLNPPAPGPDTASTAATASLPAHSGTPPAPAAGPAFATAVETTYFDGGAAPARNPSNVSVGEMLGLDQGNCTQPHASLAAVGTEATTAPRASRIQAPSHSPASAFNLNELMGTYTANASGGASTTSLQATSTHLALEAMVDRLFQMFGDLHRQLNDSTTGGVPADFPAYLPSSENATPEVLHPNATTALDGTVTEWTLSPPGNPADMPPQETRLLRYSNFAMPRARVKGEYYPPQAHQLAAHRLFRDLNSDTGRRLSPMYFVLYLRELDSVRFDALPAVLMSLFSGRLGSRGLTIMHFRPQSELEHLRRGSTNANFSSDFGAGAVLPVTEARCSTYEDLLAAIGGLILFGDALWYDHARRLLSRLKRFVLANMERDNNTPERVLLTLLHINQFLGRSLAHLMVDSPHWWRDFSESVRAVDYHSPDWQAALNGLALSLAKQTSATTGYQHPPEPRQHQVPTRRGPPSRVQVMPDHLRRLIPRDAEGLEPCLRFLSGGMCYGGSADRCAHSRRTHRWPGRLPRELQEFVDRNYGNERRNSSRRNRQ